MFKKKKKGQVVQAVFLWIFSCFFYFVIGYPFIKIIVDNIFMANNPTGIVLFMGMIVPFVPIIGLMWWGYYILDEVQGNRG